MRRYSTEVDPDKTAKAYGFELRCSPKDSRNIAHAIKGMTLESAKKYLEKVIALEKAVPAVYHNKKVSHRKGKMGPGSYPRTAARYILKVLENVENNAEYKGFDVENMRIVHISAYRGRVTPGIMPRAYGRATDKNRSTTNIEIIIEEVE